MRLLRRQSRASRNASRPAERYLLAGAEEARRLGHGYVGTEHVLLALTADPRGGAARLLGGLGVRQVDVRATACLTDLWGPRIDPAALAALGIDLDHVRERVDGTFGHGALARTSGGMLAAGRPGPVQCVAPRLKEALQNAVERAGDDALRDEHILLGLLSVPDSLAARALAELGVTIGRVEPLAG